MYFDDHNPPHFHAIYNEFEALVAIEDFSILWGSLPPKALALGVEWASIHRSELLTDWGRAISHKELMKIEPLN